MFYHSVINGFGFFICQVERVNYRKLKERAELTRFYFQGEVTRLEIVPMWTVQPGYWEKHFQLRITPHGYT